jgi:hypothetical protein
VFSRQFPFTQADPRNGRFGDRILRVFLGTQQGQKQRPIDSRLRAEGSGFAALDGKWSARGLASFVFIRDAKEHKKSLSIANPRTAQLKAHANLGCGN